MPHPVDWSRSPGLPGWFRIALQGCCVECTGNLVRSVEHLPLGCFLVPALHVSSSYVALPVSKVAPAPGPSLPTAVGRDRYENGRLHRMVRPPPWSARPLRTLSPWKQNPERCERDDGRVGRDQGVRHTEIGQLPVHGVPSSCFRRASLSTPTRHRKTASHILQMILPRRWVDRLTTPHKRRTR